MSRVNTFNEWDPLEEVIVGRVEGARIPRHDKGLHYIEFPEISDTVLCPSGPFPQQCIEETEEDLSLLVQTLERAGITVRRPEPFDHGRVVRSPDWETDGMFNYCPRDLFLVAGDTFIEAPMVLRARQHESLSFKALMLDYFQSGAGWISAPRPRLLDSVYKPPENGGSFIEDSEPIFDAANVVRLGRDLLYQVSESGNYLGARWLQRTLGSAYKVHAVDNLRNTVHIDTTVIPIRPGLVMVNEEFVSAKNLPSIFKKWDVIYFSDVVEKEVLQKDVVMSSKWIGMNFMMLSPTLALVERDQTPLIRALERAGVDACPLPLRHAQTLGGGFHCVTLDVRRRGRLEAYCD